MGNLYFILIDLVARFSYQWLHNHIIVLAGDAHLKWNLARFSDGLTALSDMDHVLRIFRLYGFSINIDKSVILFRVVGKGAQQFTKRWVIRTKVDP